MDRLRLSEPGLPSTDLIVKPRPREIPFTANRAIRNLEHHSDLFLSQPAEEFQFHDAAFSWIELLQSYQRFVDRQEVTGSLLSVNARFVQRRLKGAASSLGPALRACSIDQNFAHQLRRHAEEVRSVLPPDIVPTDQSNVRFMDQRRCLQRMVRAFAGHIESRQPVKFLLNLRNKLFERLLVSL